MAFGSSKNTSRNNDSADNDKDSKGGARGNNHNSSVTCDMTSYDSSFSSLTYRLFNGSGMLDLSPIDAEFIGKQPKKGDRVYDHDNSVSVFISANTAVTLRHAFKALQEAVDSEQTDFNQVKVSFGNASVGERSVTLFAPGATKVRMANREYAETSNNFVLRFDIAKNEELIKVAHILQNSEMDYIAGKDIVATQVIYSGLVLFMEFLEGVIVNATNTARHGAYQATRYLSNGSGRGGKSTAGTSFAKSAFDDGDDDDNSEAPAENKAAAPKGKTNVRRALAEEMNDDDLPG